MILKIKERERKLGKQISKYEQTASNFLLFSYTFLFSQEDVLPRMRVFSGVALVQSCGSLGITGGAVIPSVKLDMIPYLNIPLEFPPSCISPRGQAILVKFN